MIEKFIAFLHKLELEPTPEEVADILWYAAQKLPIASAANLPPKRELAAPSSSESPTVAPSESIQKPPVQQFIEGQRRAKKELKLYPAAKDNQGIPFRSPSGSALPGALKLVRALRPLMRRVASLHQVRLDEAATAHQIAQTDIWMPVLQPVSIPWLDVAVVVEDSPSMCLWQQTVQELCQLLERQGAFRDVRLWHLDTADEMVLTTGTSSVKHSYRELINPAASRVILVVTDCISSVWHNGKMNHWLTVWGHEHAVALVQMLPQQLWFQTQVRAAHLLHVTAPYSGAANKRLNEVSLPWARNKIPSGGMATPILTLEPDFMAVWVQFIASPTANKKMPALVFKESVTKTGASKAKLSAKQRFIAFKANASPTALQLACLLAATPLTLPIMRLVQKTMLPESQQIHLAEFFLSGLLRRVDTDFSASDAITYDFLVDGFDIRGKLLDMGLVPDAIRVQQIVSEYVAIHYGQPNDFQAKLENPELLADGGSGNEFFARVSVEVLRRLGGRYAKAASLLTSADTNDSIELIDEQNRSEKEVKQVVQKPKGAMDKALKKRIHNGIHNEIANATVQIWVANEFSGTGFFITPDGHILTAYHCIGDYAPEIFIETYFGERFNVKLDEGKSLKHFELDIAVLKVLHRKYYTEHCLPLGMISERHITDDIVSLGYPAGHRNDNQQIGIYLGNISKFRAGNRIEIAGALRSSGQAGAPVYHYATNRVIGIATGGYKAEIMMNSGVATQFVPLFEKWSELKLINEWVVQSWDERLKNIRLPVNYENGLTKLGKYIAEYVEKIQDLQLRDEFDLHKFQLRRILEDKNLYDPDEKLDSDIRRVIFKLNAITRKLNIGMSFDDLCVQRDTLIYPTDDGKKTPVKPKTFLQIDKDDKKQLVTLLLECPTIKNEENRGRLLKELQPSLSTPIGFNKSSILHVHNIVNACIKDKGGIETLIDLLRYFEEDETPVQAFEETLKDILTSKPITNTQLKELRSLLKSFSLPDDNKLKAIYDKSVPQNMSAPPYDHDKSRIDCILDWLADMGLLISTGHVPMLDFVVQLIPYANISKNKNNLKAWITKVGKHFVLTDTQINGLLNYDKSPQQPITPVHLLIELIELNPQQDKFIVDAWYVKSPNDIKNVSIEDDKTFTLDDMPKLLDKLLASINNDLIAANDQLTIEFFLPFHLLCYPVEHWNVPSMNVPLGILYPVVVRSLDRFKNERFWPSWKAHWDNDKLHKVISDTDVGWMDEDRFRAVYSKLNGTDAICLVMTFPHETIVDPKQAVLLHAIKLGMPIALWARKIDESDDIQKEFNALLAAGPLESLPERVRKKREEKWAAGEEHKAGYNLSLLWDNPNRIPVTNFKFKERA